MKKYSAFLFLFLFFGLFVVYTNIPARALPAPLVTPPPTPPPSSDYYGIIAHRDDCPNSNTGGILFWGNGYLTISGGSIQSHSCLEANESIYVAVLDGNIEYITDYSINGNPVIIPAPEQVAENYPIEVEDFVDCSGLPSASSDGNGTISPGIYAGISVTDGEVLSMAPGLYCFTDDFSVEGGTVTGEGVTLYMQSGDFLVSWYETITLSAPQTPPVDPSEGYLGLLIGMAGDNAGQVDITGSSLSTFVGTVYAGSEDSRVILEATGKGTIFNLNFYAGTVVVHTNSIVDIIFPKVYFLPVTKTAPEEVSPGDLLTYTLTVPNLHNFAPVHSVVLTDTLPAGTTFVTATLPFTRTGDTITWMLDSLPHNSVWQTQLVVQVPFTTTQDTLLNEFYGVIGEGAYASAGIPVTTTVNLPPTLTPSPTPTDTPTPTETPTPTPTLTPTPTGTPPPQKDLYFIYLPRVIQEP